MMRLGPRMVCRWFIPKAQTYTWQRATEVMATSWLQLPGADSGGLESLPAATGYGSPPWTSRRSLLPYGRFPLTELIFMLFFPAGAVRLPSVVASGRRMGNTSYFNRHGTGGR